MELQASTSRERQGWGCTDSVLTILAHRPSAYLQHGGGVDWLEFAEQLTHSLALPQGEGRWALRGMGGVLGTWNSLDGRLILHGCVCKN